MDKDEFVLIRILSDREFTPLSRSKKFLEIISTLPKDKQFRLLEGFAKYLSEEIKSQIVRSIKEQKFKVKFTPLSKGYADYKKRNNLMEGFWRSTGFLLNHIHVWKYETEYRVGFRNADKYEGGPKVLDVARWLEYGTFNSDGSVKNPARPCFIPVVKQISKNISFYLDKYLSLINFTKL